MGIQTKADLDTKTGVKQKESVTEKFTGKNALFGPNYWLPIDEWKFPELDEEPADLSHPLAQKVMARSASGKFIHS